MDKKFDYRVKDQITQGTVRDIESSKVVEHDAKVDMQEAVRRSHKANPFPDGEYFVDTYRSNEDKPTGPSNSFTVKDGNLTFNELPYGQ